MAVHAGAAATGNAPATATPSDNASKIARLDSPSSQPELLAVKPASRPACLWTHTCDTGRMNLSVLRTAGQSSARPEDLG
jgi:hypothetical protein